MEEWKDPITPLIWLSFGSFLVLFFIGFITLLFRTYTLRIRKEEEEKRKLLLEHQRQLLENTIAIEERERLRIAQNLHDDLLAQLYRIKLMNKDDKLSKALENSMDNLRLVSHELSPPLLEEISFEELITDFLSPFHKNYFIDFHTHVTNTSFIPKEKKLQLFRIFQEVMVNIEKHAQADRISLGWRKSSQWVCLCISDNGKGFSNHRKIGLGLKNIETRVQVVQGFSKFKPNTPSGTTFLLAVKL